MQKFRDLYVGTLTAAITLTQTVFNVTKGAGLTDLWSMTNTDYFFIKVGSGTTAEVMKVITVIKNASNNSLTVERGQSGSQFAQPAGAPVELIHAANGMELIHQGAIDINNLIDKPLSVYNVAPLANEYYNFRPDATQQLVIQSNLPGWKLNLNHGGGCGESFMVLHRLNAAFAWPVIYYDGTVANVRNAAPTGLTGLLRITTADAKGPISAPVVVSMEWNSLV